MKHQRTLSDSSILRYITFTALYVAQGLPLGVLTVALPAWLATQGMGTAKIGEFVAITTIPWSLKLVWGPLMDRYGFLSMGKRRPWVLMAQLGLTLSFFSLTLVSDPIGMVNVVAIIGFAISLCASMQDVAVDGMAIEALPEAQRARANGLMFGGQGLGLSLAASATGALLGDYGLSIAILPAGVVIALILFLTIVVRERPGEKMLPWTEGCASSVMVNNRVTEWSAVVRSLLRSFVLPMSLLAALIVFVFRVGSGIMTPFLTVFTVQELDWSDADYANTQAVATLITVAIGILIIGPAVDRLGALRVAYITGVLWMALCGAAGMLSDLWLVRSAVTAFMIGTSVLSIAVAISFGSVFMGMCWQRVAATQFALYMALVNLGLAVGSALTGTLDATLSHQQIFFAIAACGGVFLLLLFFLNLNTHQQRLSELNETGKIEPT